MGGAEPPSKGRRAWRFLGTEAERRGAILRDFLERVESARNLTDVAIAAGIAGQELDGVEDEAAA